MEESHPRVVGPMYDRLLALGAHTLGEVHKGARCKSGGEGGGVLILEWRGGGG